MRPKYKNCVSIVIIISLLFSLAGCGKSVKEDNKVRLQDDYWYYSNVEKNQTAESEHYYAKLAKEYELTYQLIKDIGSKEVDYKVPCSEQVVHDVYNQMLDFIVNKDQCINDDYKEMADLFLSAKNMHDIDSINIKLENRGMYHFLVCYCKMSIGAYGSIDGIFNEFDFFLGYNLNEIAKYDFTKEYIRKYVHNVLLSVGKSENEASSDADSFVENLFEFAEVYQAEDQVEYMKNHIDEVKSSDVDCAKAFYAKFFGGDNYYNYKIVLLSEYMHRWEMFLANDYDFLKEYRGFVFRECVKDDYDLAAAYTAEIFDRYVSDLYYDEYFNEEMVAFAEEAYQGVKAEYIEMISNCSWLSEDSKNNLLQHIEDINLVVSRKDNSLSEKEYDYLGENVLETIQKHEKIWMYDLLQEYQETGKADFYDTSSYEINACYIIESNNIGVKVGAIKYLLNEYDSSDALMILQSIMAHEMGHSLDYVAIYSEDDDMFASIKEDEELRNLITEDEAKYLQEINDSLIAYYSDFTVLDQYNVDGELTVHENYADILSMECMMDMYETKEDREKVFSYISEFFYDDLSEDKIKKYLASDTHSYSRVRINAMYSNCDSFYETYDVKPEDMMYVAPESRIHVFK